MSQYDDIKKVLEGANLPNLNLTTNDYDPFQNSNVMNFIKESERQVAEVGASIRKQKEDEVNDRKEALKYSKQQFEELQKQNVELIKVNEHLKVTIEKHEEQINELKESGKQAIKTSRHATICAIVSTAIAFLSLAATIVVAIVK